MKNLIDVLKEFESQIKGITNEEDIQNKFEELAKLTEWETFEVWANKIWFQVKEEHKQTYSEKYVSSDISVMCDEFARKALAENSDITMDICKKVIKNFTPSVSQEDIEYYKSFMEWYQRV